MALDVSVKDQDGKELFARQKEYTVNDLYFKGGKRVAMAEWDVTATEHFDLGLKPNVPDINTFIIPLKIDTTSVDVEVRVIYLYERDKTFTLDKVVQKIFIEQ